MNKANQNALRTIREWRSSYRAFRCVPENAAVFEQQAEKMVEIIDTLLQMIPANDDGLPWCEPCKSYHVEPRDAEHKALLQCRAPEDSAMLFERITAAELLQGDIVLIDHRGLTTPIHFIDYKDEIDVGVRINGHDGFGGEIRFASWRFGADEIVLRKLSPKVLFEQVSAKDLRTGDVVFDVPWTHVGEILTRTVDGVDINEVGDVSIRFGKNTWNFGDADVLLRRLP